jgi:hypothetical protein
MRLAIPILLVIVGLAQIVGDLARIDAIKAIGAATHASPAPKVFSSVRGLETYSTRFVIEVGARRIPLTPDLYARVRGPYNRRNVYGAALAYAPLLPTGLLDSILRHALCGDAPLLRELGIARAPGERVTVVLEPRSGTPPELRTRFDAPCR